MSNPPIPTQHSPRYPIAHPAPGCMCECGHREGSHNDLGRCVAGDCSCGGYPHAPREEWAGFRPVEGTRCRIRHDEIMAERRAEDGQEESA